ncbi:hypothetical protein [Clostridium perfringens]|nr:hypothetical protein [Clostridium perfringens]
MCTRTLIVKIQNSHNEGSFILAKFYEDIEECLRNQRKYKKVNGALR